MSLAARQIASEHGGVDAGVCQLSLLRKSDVRAVAGLAGPQHLSAADLADVATVRMVVVDLGIDRLDERRLRTSHQD